MALPIKKLNRILLVLSVLGLGTVLLIHVHRDIQHSERPSNPIQLSDISIPSYFNIKTKLLNTPASPKTNIVFIKVHKAASTTLQNVFLRFAIDHHLNVLLHRDKLHINEHSHKLKRPDIIALPPNKQFNILTHHIVFNKKEISRFFPSNNTVYIGIVREPYSRFVSALYYYGFVWNITGLKECVRESGDPVNSFLLKPDKYDPAKRVGWSQVNNRISRDFGMNPRDIIDSKTNETVTQNFIDNLDSDIDLVLIMEQFDASIIMLKRRLHWKFKDVLYMKINQLTNEVKPKTTSNYKINRAMYKKYAPSEFAIYDHFYSLFMSKVARLGQDFEDEVKAFKGIRKRVTKFCEGTLESHESSQSVLGIEATKWSQPFQVSSHDCILMQTPEIPLTDIVRNIQNKRFARFFRRQMRD